MHSWYAHDFLPHTHTDVQHIGNMEVGSTVMTEELKRLQITMEASLEGLSQRMNQLENSLTSVASRVTALEL